MTNDISRRGLIRGLALGMGALFAGRGAFAKSTASDGSLKRITEDDDEASALSYYSSASKVRAKDFPSFKPGQKCANCAQSKGNAGDAWLACAVLPKKLVNAEGWCSVYAPKKT